MHLTLQKKNGLVTKLAAITSTFMTKVYDFIIKFHFVTKILQLVTIRNDTHVVAKPSKVVGAKVPFKIFYP